MRALFYSHDGQGLGHVRRNLAVADAVSRLHPTASVLVVCSTDHVDSLVVPPRVDILKLPGLRKVTNTSYAARRLPMTGGETAALRSALIASATASFAPQVLLSDKHPHGAHGELRAALTVLKAAGGRAVLGLRDILDDPATVRAEWRAAGVLDAVAADYDRVLVYGNRNVLDPAEAYGMTAPVRRMVRYCGYVANTPPAHDGTSLSAPDGRPVVLASAGGGEDGFALLSAFVDASRGAPWHPVVVSGTGLGEADQLTLQRRVVEVGGTYHRFVRNLPVHFPSVSALVCMGGYNTTAEAVRAAVPTVVVPRVRPRQEQLLRARAFAELGVVRTLHPDELAGDHLGAAVLAALGDTRQRIAQQVARSIDVNGAERAAAELLSLVAPAQTPARRSMSPSEGSRTAYVLKMYPRFSETFIVNEVLAAEAAGEQVEIFSLRPPADGRFHESLAQVRAPVTYLRSSGLRAADVWDSLAHAHAELPGLADCLDDLLRAPVVDAVQALELARLIRARSITHLHAHFASVATTVARLASLLTGVPFSFTAHAKDIFHESVEPADVARKLADASAVVTVSDYNLAFLRETYGTVADVVTRVYNGLDLQRFRYSSPAQRPAVIAAVGRLVEKKGFADLVDAVALLVAEGRDVSVDLVGTGPLEAALREQVRGLSLQDVVRMHGPLPQGQVQVVVSGAAVFAAPCVVGSDGNRDGLPTVLLEAMALGTPCVATPVTGIPEAVRDGETGLLVRESDPVALAGALGRLLDDAALRVRLAEGARALVEQEFDVERAAATLRRVFAGTSVRAALSGAGARS